MKRLHKPYFRKPNQLCTTMPTALREATSLGRFSFNRWFYDDINARESKLNVHVRKGGLQDIPSVKAFTDKHYTQLEGNDLTSYDFYRFTEYGNTLLLETEGRIIGVIFEIGYDTPERTSYAMRFVIEPHARGQGYAQLLTDAVCLKALERGSSVIRATIAIENHVSLFFHLNKVGMIIEGINPIIKGLTRYYQASLPVSPFGIFENRIDRNKLVKFIETHQEGEDFWLYNSTDFEKIEEALLEEHKKLVAYLPIGRKRFQFLALKPEDIQFFYEYF